MRSAATRSRCALPRATSWSIRSTPSTASDCSRRLRVSGLLFTFGQLIDALLHILELALHLVEFAAGRFFFLAFGSGLTLPTCERDEHRKRPFKHFHVPADLILHRPETD